MKTTREREKEVNHIEIETVVNKEHEEEKKEVQKNRGKEILRHSFFIPKECSAATTKFWSSCRRPTAATKHTKSSGDTKGEKARSTENI